jgi:hypothetical protein
MPGDPHPNGIAHAIMADMLYPVVAEDGTWTPQLNSVATGH